MANEVKLAQEEITKIQQLQNSYQQVVLQLGQVRIERDRLQKSEEDLLRAYNELQTQESTFIDELNKKYGNGTINLNSGTFVAENDEESEKE